MSHETEVAKSGDEMIARVGERESGIVDYRIGTKITVSWRGGKWGDERRWLCHTCVINTCVHTKRVARYRADVEGEES